MAAAPSGARIMVEATIGTPVLAAARAVALAKASSMAGAIMGGAWIGLLAYLLPMLGRVAAARSDTHRDARIAHRSNEFRAAVCPLWT